MRTVVLLLLLLGGPLRGWAQDPADRHVLLPPVPRQLDSLQARLRRPALPDSTRLKLLVLFSKYYAATRNDSSLAYGRRALALARRQHLAWGEAKAWLAVAEARHNNSDYLAAQQAVQQALRCARASGEALLVGYAYVGLGNVATSLGDTAAVETYYEQARRSFARTTPRSVGAELSVLLNRATNYLDNDEDPARALRLLREGLQLLVHHPGGASAAKLHLLVGIGQNLQQHPDSAARSWREAIRLSRAERNALVENEAWLYVGLLELKRHAHPAALAAGRQATRLARLIGDPELLDGGLSVQAQALVGLRRPEAYDSLQAFVDFRDKVYQRRRHAAAVEAQARFSGREKEARIRALEQQRRIAGLEASQEQLRTRVGLAALGGLLLLLAGAAGATYRRRQQTREAALRTQLAADLHDDVGTLLTQISLQTDLLQEGLAPAAEQPRQWAEVAARSRLAVRQLNDVVWNLDAHNDSLPGLLNRLRDYAHEVLVPAGYDVRFAADVVGSEAPLPPAVRRGLYLIYKEALHNVLKHTPAPATVAVTLRREGAQLRLDIVNDGPPAMPLARRSGHGLRNIGERARVLGGQATAGPQPAGGFAVRVQLPG